MAGALNLQADVMRAQGEDELAGQFYSESLELFQEYGMQSGIAGIEHNQGYLALHRGDLRGALGLFARALGRAQKLNNRWTMADAMIGIGGVLARTGQEQEGTRLLAAGTQMHESIYASSLMEQPANYMEWEQSVALARTALSDAAFEAAWAEGKDMTEEDAVACAWRYSAQPHLNH
jgi:hypothetical protein